VVEELPSTIVLGEDVRAATRVAAVRAVCVGTLADS